jgi:uncharacterized membrane protein YedE/YeeE
MAVAQAAELRHGGCESAAGARGVDGQSPPLSGVSAWMKGPWAYACRKYWSAITTRYDVEQVLFTLRR